MFNTLLDFLSYVGGFRIYYKRFESMDDENIDENLDGRVEELTDRSYGITWKSL